MAERELLGISAHQVPGDADEGEQQDTDEDVDRKRARDDLRQRDQHHRKRDQRGNLERASHQRTLPPPRPFGLKASVRSSMANTTIRPESAPTNWIPSDSATPIMRLATSAPTT